MEKYKVNDAHVHIGKSSGVLIDTSPDDITKYIDQHNLENILLMSLDENVNQNNKIIGEMAKNDKRIHGLYWIQKNQIDFDVKCLSQGLNEKKYVGVKFHGAFEHLPPTSEVYKPIMEVLSKNNACILIHCGRYNDGSRSSVTSFEYALELATNYPQINIILAHMGGNDTSIVKKAVSYALGIDNVYFDTSGISTPVRVEVALRSGLSSDRILFGSDAMWCSFRGNYYNLLDARISEEDKNKIFYDNFKKVIMKK